MSRLGTLGSRLYRGEISYDFVGRQRRWYTISAVILLLAIAGLLIRHLHLGIDFRGGAEFQVTSPTVSIARAQDVLASSGVGGEPRVQTLGGDTILITTQQLSQEQTRTVQQSLATAFGVPAEQVSTQFVGPSWGRDISTKALRGLLIFLVLVVLYLSVAFEWKMAISAIIALLHDIVITVGIYALVGFEVTPATVIGLLTILGYSLYDTVVVFDKVRENTAGLQGGSRMTYSEAANMAVNQTLVRSINTSVIALLPIGAILFVGAGLLGAGTLKDLSLSLFIGVAAGTYSSIFIATPLLADLKEREPQMAALAKRVAARRSTPAAAAGVPSGRSSAQLSTASAPRARRRRAAVLEAEQNGADTGAPESEAGRQGGHQRPIPRTRGQQPPRTTSPASAGPGTGAGSGTEAGFETDAGAGTDSGSGTQAGFETEAGLGTDSGSGTEAGRRPSGGRTQRRTNSRRPGSKRKR